MVGARIWLPLLSRPRPHELRQDDRLIMLRIGGPIHESQGPGPGGRGELVEQLLRLRSGEFGAVSDVLVDEGVQEFQGQTFRQFTGGPFTSGQSLTFRLTRPGAAVDAKLVGGVAFLLVGAGVIGYGVWRMRRPAGKPQARPTPPGAPRKRASNEAEREKILDQLAALDDAFDAGQIAEADYRKQRGALKAKALRLIREE